MSRFSRPSASALGRFLQLGGTGARIAGNLLVQRITPGKARIDCNRWASCWAMPSAK